MRMLPVRVPFLLVLVALVGCGGKPKNTSALIKGKVSLPDGKPLPGGQIVFHPGAGGGKPVSGSIGADGTYELTVAPGDYKVTVDNSSLRGSTSTATPGGGGAMPGMSGGSQKYVPIKATYTRPESSGLSVKADPPTTTYNVDLK